ncbi:amino acid permease [Lactobacillus delbrueckii]|uniref:amino acid permease n=1 Tax=Lactobacillus delbrueckii TaxID=1584 RepID=UPI001C25855F
MLCLGELSVAMPCTGSFHVYAKNLLNPATGFTVAILYWLTWTIALGSEFTAAGIIMRHWFPSVPVWIWSLVFMILIFLSNFFSVKIFAESEFWFVAVKVAAIVAFIILGGLAVVGVIPLKGSQGGTRFDQPDQGRLVPDWFWRFFYHYAHGQLCLLGDGADRDDGRGSQGTGRKDPA